MTATVPGAAFDDTLARAPGPRAQLGVLMHLARAAHAGRADLLRAARTHAGRRSGDRLTWLHYLDRIAEEYADRAPRMKEPADALRIMDRVLTSPVVETSEPEVTASLIRMRAAIETALQDESDPLDHLVDANLRAHAAISEWLDVHGVVSNLEDGAARLRLVYVARSGEFCALSDTIGKRIQWMVAPTDIAFWSAVQAPSILKHEYLSHFAPRHDRLPADVREGWLMDVLHEELDRAQPDEREADTMALRYLRERLVTRPVDSNTGRREPPDYHGGMKDLAERIRFANEKLYWNVTRAVIGVRRGDDDLVARIDRTLRALLTRSRAGLAALADGGDAEIDRILEEIDGRSELS